MLTFSYNNSTVRIIDKDGEPWFCLKDVCNVLQISFTQRAAKNMDKDEIGTVTIRHDANSTRANFVSEPGLYKLIMRSRKPEARAFQRWVTHEVLPSIRQTGRYLPGASEELGTLDAEIRRKAEYEFRCAVQARALAMRNLHRSAEEERAITEAAIAEEAKGASLDIDTIERREPPEATYRRMIHRVVMFGTSDPMTRLEEVQRKGGFLN